MRVQNNLLKFAIQILRDQNGEFPNGALKLFGEVERHIQLLIKSDIEGTSKKTSYPLVCEIELDGNHELLQLNEAVNQGWVEVGKKGILLYGPKSLSKGADVCLNGSLDELRPIFNTAPEPLRKKYFDTLENECLSTSDKEDMLSAIKSAVDLGSDSKAVQPEQTLIKATTSALHSLKELSGGYILKIFSDSIRIPQIGYHLASPVVRSADSPTVSNSSESKEEQVKPSWIEIKLEDEEGNPVPGKKYKIELPDGAIATGKLDEKGFARVEGIDPDRCEITFPEFDK